MSNDTDRTSSLPSTIPPPPETPGEQALMQAFLRIEKKFDRVLEMLGKLTLLVEDVHGAQSVLSDRVAALEAIPPRPTILPPANGSLDG